LSSFEEAFDFLTGTFVSYPIDFFETKCYYVVARHNVWRHIVINGDFMDSKSDFQTFFPLTEATFFILMNLSSGPKHGYAIMKEVHEMSKGRIRFSTGTLYGALKRLLDQDWIVRGDEGVENGEETSRTRKEYELTSLGKKVLQSEIDRMRDLVRLAASISPEEA
jgi:DNA-binding PadR family transcriptional regulator